MVKLTGKEKEVLADDVLGLSQKLTNDVVDDLNSACNTLKELFQDVRMGNYECDKLQELNSRVSTLQGDTLLVCEEVKALLREAEIVNGD